MKSMARQSPKVGFVGLGDQGAPIARCIVEAMLFLCSEQASFVTGETLRVSGGYPPAI